MEALRDRLIARQLWMPLQQEHEEIAFLQSCNRDPVTASAKSRRSSDFVLHILPRQDFLQKDKVFCLLSRF